MNDNYYLLLFDIDGTLIRSAGAGKKAMERALEAVYGVKNGLRNIQMMGRTDPSIVDEVVLQYHLVDSKEKRERFRNFYFGLLEDEIKIESPEKRVCAGIESLLKILHQKEDAILGLLTGNWRQSGLIKLRHFGIDGYFETGAFADDSPLREELAPIAVERAEKLKGQSISKERVFVIGDTPLDIQSARPSGVKTVAVATGIHTLDQLASEKPDFLFADFEDNDKFMERIFNHRN
jgi:phosphoglycolate phosphatase